MNRTTRRAGFSLIEILISLTIMAIVVALLLSFLGTTGSAAREAATKATLVKLDSLLQTRYRQVLDSMASQERKRARASQGPPKTFAAWLTLQSEVDEFLPAPPRPMYTTFVEPPAAKLAIMKCNRLRGAFPQSIADVAPLPVNSDTNPVSWVGFTDPNELLYQILFRSGESGQDSQIRDSINPRHIQYLNAEKTRAIFVDDWGQPLRFYFSPTKLVRPGNRYSLPTPQQYSLAKSLIPSLPPLPTSATDFTSLFNQDPLDPRGALRQPTFATTQARYFDAAPIIPSGSSFEALYHTPDTWFVPLIVSSGQDEALGMEEPGAANANRHGFVTNPDEAADNLTSAQK